jgi:tetratricopeptide (TPR) repeat protein
LPFTAESDGLYGFFIVLCNAAGATSPPPTSGTAPQQWIRVDREAPIVQILAVRPDEHFGLNRELTIRWTAEDADLPDRPVSLHYRSEKTRSYRLIAELLEPIGSFRWTAPEDLATPFSIKVTAIDRAGNTGRSVASEIVICDNPTEVRMERTTPALPLVSASAEETSQTPAPSAMSAFVGAEQPDVVNPAGNKEVRSEAQRKYDAGTRHRLRAETDLAMARYREALAIDPGFSAARHDLAALLLLVGQPEQAEPELRTILEEDPAHRAALRTLALVQARRQNYRSAAETLQRLLLLAPDDAEAWLAFGDVTMFMGDRAGARAAWGNVEKLTEAPEKVRSRAAERLKLYSGRPMQGLASAEGEP